MATGLCRAIDRGRSGPTRSRPVARSKQRACTCSSRSLRKRAGNRRGTKEPAADLTQSAPFLLREEMLIPPSHFFGLVAHGVTDGPAVDAGLTQRAAQGVVEGVRKLHAEAARHDLTHAGDGPGTTV